MATLANKDDTVDAVRNLITAKLAEKNLNRKEVSLAIGRNETFIHQFLHRGTPRELAERERHVLAALLQIEEAELRGPEAAALHSGQTRTNGGSVSGDFGHCGSAPTTTCATAVEVYERALRKIAAGEPKAAEIARVALLLFE
jgi:hypothetical protein